MLSSCDISFFLKYFLSKHQGSHCLLVTVFLITHSYMSVMHRSFMYVLNECKCDDNYCFLLVVEKKKHKMVAAEYSYSLYFIYIYMT